MATQLQAPIQQTEPRLPAGLLADLEAFQARMAALRAPFQAANDRTAALLGEVQS